VSAPVIAGGLAAIEPVSLEELERIAALDVRVDRKYVVAAGAMAALLGSLPEATTVLEIGGERAFRYRSLYFDTDNLALYRSSAQGRRVRYKVRTRAYDNGTCALEVKTPGLRGATIKHRLSYDPAHRDGLTRGGRAFVDSCTGAAGLGARLGPVLLTWYVRSTLVDHADGSRVTIDQELTCGDLGGGRAVLAGPVVVETKSTGAATATDGWLWRHGHRPVRISKFGVGMALFDPALPANRWNRVLRRHFAWEPGHR
jgi:hypothetical protein